MERRINNMKSKITIMELLLESSSSLGHAAAPSWSCIKETLTLCNTMKQFSIFQDPMTQFNAKFYLNIYLWTRDAQLIARVTSKKEVDPSAFFFFIPYPIFHHQKIHNNYTQKINLIKPVISIVQLQSCLVWEILTC